MVKWWKPCSARLLCWLVSFLFFSFSSSASMRVAADFLNMSGGRISEHAKKAHEWTETARENFWELGPHFGKWHVRFAKLLDMSYFLLPFCFPELANSNKWLSICNLLQLWNMDLQSYSYVLCFVDHEGTLEDLFLHGDFAADCWNSITLHCPSSWEIIILLSRSICIVWNNTTIERITMAGVFPFSQCANASATVIRPQ